MTKHIQCRKISWKSTKTCNMAAAAALHIIAESTIVLGVGLNYQCPSSYLLLLDQTPPV